MVPQQHNEEHEVYKYYISRSTYLCTGSYIRNQNVLKYYVRILISCAQTLTFAVYYHIARVNVYQLSDD